MYTSVKLYSDKKNEIFKFLTSFYSFNENIQHDKTNFNTTQFNKNDNLEWENTYQNPIEIADIIGTFIENNDKYKINMWISIDDDVYINVTEQNADEIIRYLFERFPY